MTTLSRVARVLALIVLTARGVGSQPVQTIIGPVPRYASASSALERFISHEMADKKLPALSIALVEDQSVVWARGFGIANGRDSTLATARTIYRVGSVSK